MPETIYHDSDTAYACDECGEEWASWEAAENCCAEPDDDEYGDDGPGEAERADSAAEVPKLEVPALLIPALPARPARLVSIEQETVGDSGETALAEMYAAGLAVSDQVRGSDVSVISEAPGGRKIYATNDPTCGVELTYALLRLDTLADAMTLGQGIVIAREHARLSMRCGFHVHVSARRVDGGWLAQDDLIALREEFTRVEPLLYRLAAARWSRHRGGEYCADGPNVSGVTTKTGKLSLLDRAGRYHGLNLTPYLQSRSSCGCPAGEYGIWDECTCALGGTPTVEFRLWNGTANPTKVRAYVALSAALVAHAVAVAARDTAPFANGGLGVQLAELARLPLTAEEREAVAYCARHANLSGQVPESALDAFVGGE